MRANQQLSFVGCGELANRINRERCGSFVTASYVLAELDAMFMRGK